MAEIAVIHRHLGIGGSESVCFHILDALQADHDIHLYTLSPVNINKLNKAFDTSIKNITTHTAESTAKCLSGLNSGLNAISGSIGIDSGLELCILFHLFQSQFERHDLRITTHGELPLTSPAIQYIHHPFFNRWTCNNHFQIKNTAGKTLNLIYTHATGADPNKIAETHLLVNSKWSARQLSEIYPKKPEVLYPPIDMDRYSNSAWETRENGFVSIGRVSKDKEIHRGIQIISALRERGHDVHLHHVGPIDTDDPYAVKINTLASNLDYVRLEGRQSRKQVDELIQSHMWGIHTKPFEHFGMSVAEMVAGGMIPTVHSSGGQVEIINDLQMLQYSENTEAINRASALINDHELAKKLRKNIQQNMDRYCADQFTNRITSLADELIS